MAKIVIRRRDLEHLGYKQRDIRKLIAPSAYETTMEATRTEAGWKIVLQYGDPVFLPPEAVHAILNIHIQPEKLRHDPNFPMDHPIWGLPVVQIQIVTGDFIQALEATAVEFHGYFRINLHGTITCFIHEDQARVVSDIDE